MEEYYLNQAGSGLAGFHGIRYQKGSGFMGRMISGTLVPILKKIIPFLGKTALNAGSNLLNDYESGEPLRKAMKRRFSETKDVIAQRTKDKFKELTGGKRRRVVKAKKDKRKSGTKKRKTRSKTKKTKSRKAKSRRSRKSSAFDFL